MFDHRTDIRNAHREDARRLAGLILFRLLMSSALFGGAVIAGLAVSSDESFARGSLFAYLSTAYVTAALEFLWVLFGLNVNRLGFCHAGIEAALAAWLIALTGGADSPFIFLLLVATVLSAVAAGSIGAFVSATISTCALFAFSVGLPIAGLSYPLHPMDGRTMAVTLASAGGCYATAALASYLAERLRRTGRQLNASEARLRELGELYLKVVQSLRSGLMTLGPAPAEGPGMAIVTLLNDPGAAILGVSADAAQGRPLADSIPNLAHALNQELIRNGRGEVNVKQDERQLLLGFSFSPLRGEGAASPGSVVTFQDLTAQRKLEEALRRQTHLASLGELAAGLAHEIRNPLAALSGAAQILRTLDIPTLQTDVAKLFDVIQREIAHLDSLVSDFLTFARPPKPMIVHGDLTELALGAFDAFRASEELGTRRLEFESVPILANFDAGQIRQVIWNLLRNALEATDANGSIRLAIQKAGESILIEVTDDGHGVPPELREQIFEPFFTTKERGTGLGLALVGRIVGSHQGTIEIDSSRIGTRFTVRLPAMSSAQLRS